MKKGLLIGLCAALIFLSCKKNYDVEATYAKPAVAATWAKQETFYSPNPQIFLEATNTWRNFISFSFTSSGDPNKLGFANPYNAGKGTNALYMATLYSSQSLTTDSGYYNITIPKCFEFIPKSPDVLTEGTVEVIPQKVRLYRRDKTFFEIGISEGSQPGTYNTISKIFEIEVSFDETSIGGPANVKRKYRFTS
jgi:hypothetical protein